MQHTKFQGHWLFGSGEDVFRFSPNMGMAAILVMWPGPFEQTSFPHPREAPYEIWLWLTQWFQRRRCLKSVDDVQTTDGRTDNGGLLYLSYKLTKWDFGSGELKMLKNLPFRTFSYNRTEVLLLKPAIIPRLAIISNLIHVYIGFGSLNDWSDWGCADRIALFRPLQSTHIQFV